MSQSNYITLALSVFIGLIFLIDYLKKRKEDSLEKSVEKFVEKEPETKERSGVLNWILKRKKNITFFVILVSTLKLFLNYFVYTIHLKFNSPFGHALSFRTKEKEELFLESLKSKDIVILKDKNDIYEGVYHNVDKFSHKSFPADFSVHLENIFSYDLFLFIPSTVFILILVWIFNNKIKAQ